MPWSSQVHEQYIYKLSIHTVWLVLEGVNHVLSSPSPSIPGSTPVSTHKSKESTTKNVGEDVVHPWATPTTFPQTLFSIAVVKVLLFWVGQNLIGKTDFFKLYLREQRKKMWQDTIITIKKAASANQQTNVTGSSAYCWVFIYYKNNNNKWPLP